MDRYRSVRITHISKRTKHNSSSAVVPVKSKRQYGDNHIQSSSSSHLTSTTISTHAFELSSAKISTIQLMTSETSRLKTFLPNSSPSLDVVERSVKKSVKDLRNENKDKKKRFPKARFITIVIIVALFILSILAVGIYLIIRFTSKTTNTSKVVTSPLRWNTTGITVAGVGGSPGINSNQLNTPADVSVDFLNTLYIADYGNNRIQKWLNGASNGTTIAGKANGVSGSNATDLQNPAGVLVDSSGNVYIADTNNHRIQFWASGTLSGVTIAGTGFLGSNNGEFEFPYFLARDENTKTLYIADYDNNRIMSYASGASTGASTGKVAAGGNGFGTSNIQLESPVGLYFDSLTSSLLIGNSAADNIVQWVLGGSSWTQVAGMSGTQGNSSTLLQLPMGVILDPLGNMYVADAFNHRIQFFLVGQTTGTTIAGITNSPALNDIQLNRPYSIRLDNQLNLYVVDLGNHRVQQFLRY